MKLALKYGITVTLVIAAWVALKHFVLHLQGAGAHGATVSFVRNLISSGVLPHIRIGKRFYVSKAAIDAWLIRAEKRARPST